MWFESEFSNGGHQTLARICDKLKQKSPNATFLRANLAHLSCAEFS